MSLAPLLPLLVYFLIGIALGRGGILPRTFADSALKLVFYVTLPALAFLAIIDTPLDVTAVWLPLAGFGIDAVCVGIAFVVARRAALPAAEAAVLVIGAGISNMIFLFPFVLAALGPAALASAVLIDLGNAVFLATVINAVALRRGQGAAPSALAGIARLVRTPLFIALAVAVVLNVADRQPPGAALRLLAPLGQATVPLTLIALGLALDPRRLGGKLPRLTAATRMLSGFCCAGLLALIAGFDAGTALVVILAGAAPVGFSAVTFAAVARADTGQAAAAVSLSILVGIGTTAVLLLAGRALLF